MSINGIIRKSLVFLEYIIISIVSIFFISNIVNYILDGIQDYLKTFGDFNFEYKRLHILIIWLLHLTVGCLHFMSNSLYEVTRPIIARLHDGLFVELIRTLYLKGPSLHGYGFWQGKKMSDICGILTGVDASHWAIVNNTEICNRRIESDIESIVLGIEVIIALFLLFKYFNIFWERFYKT